MRFDASRTALIVTDIQPDFMEGGALPTQGGAEIVEPVRRLMAPGLFTHIVATQDWHPRGHVSFASSHPGRAPMDVIELYGHEQVLWPDHCVPGTPGAALHEELDIDRVVAIVRKGMSPEVDSYSAFRNNWGPDGTRPPTGLAGYLRERGIDTLFFCGLARDYCVKWSAEDAADAGFRTFVLWDLTRPVDAGSDEAVRAGLESKHIGVVTAEELERG